MKFKEIIALSDEQRSKKLIEIKTELVKLNGQVATGTAPKSPGRINQLKKTVAQILTFENQKKKTLTEHN